MQSNVLVVDDDLPLVELVCDILNDEAITAEACPYGYGAHACIRMKQPRAVILDIQMPQVDGIELFTSLRADPATASIPVIFFTANAQRLLHWYPNFKELDATLVQKPFDVNQLLDVVTQTLARYDRSN
jgi:CheY-like chemotaxis protein